MKFKLLRYNLGIWKSGPVICLFRILIHLSLLLCFTWNKAEAFTESQLKICALGEAEDQGIKGMSAIMSAIENRATLRGVYGCKVKKKRPAWVLKMADEAFELHKTIDLSKGADHWENVKAFGRPYWSDDSKITTTLKDHVFYKLGKVKK